MHLVAKEWLHCTVDEARERLSYEEIMSMGWFLQELEKAKQGNKQAFQPDPEDVWHVAQRLMQSNPEFFP